jgi:cyclohexanone monooxygenase
MSQLKRQYSNLGFDPDALREKYRQERDKRIRPDGNDQYIEVTGKFAHFVDDPYVERFEREPLTDEIDVVIIGGGFGGLLAGARFRQAGLNDIRIIEAGGDFGGTWYWNRYPGAQCDIEA